MNHVTKLTEESFIIKSCYICSRRYTKSMMIKKQLKYKCIVCNNRKERNENNA